MGAFRMKAHLNIHWKTAVPHKGSSMAKGISREKKINSLRVSDVGLG